MSILLFLSLSSAVHSYFTLRREYRRVCRHCNKPRSQLHKSGCSGSVVRLTDCYELLSQSDVFIFDCDGVIWKGDFLIDGAAETLAMLRGCGKKILFVTNNSTKSRKGYLGKFESLGLKVFADEIFSSSFAAAAYFQQDPLPPGKKVYVIGQEGIGEELDLIGVSHIGGPQDANKTVHIAPGAKVEHDPDVGAVVVGFDRALNYYKIQYAQLCINENPGCRFIATNLDAVANLTEQQEWAGNGSMVGAIKGCTGREPIVVGKPSSLIIDFIVDKFKVEKDRICMVGDRLDTDILFGRDNGLKTLLTLSGVTKESTLVSPSNDIIPDFVVDSIADLLKGGDRPLYSVVRC